MVANAVAGALGGLSANNMGAAASGAMAPYIANAIKKATTSYNADGTEKTNLVSNTMAHAVAGAILAEISGGDGAAGAAGAAGGELIARAIVSGMYPGVKASDLTESQKQTVSALSQLAAGLAGGLASNSSTGVAVGAGTGKNAVENNSLTGDKARETLKQVSESLKNQVRDKLGMGTTSSIANGIINALTDTGDAALGSVDYAADAVMAMASCATHDSYCDTAINDLSNKNQGVADKVKALISSSTWSAVAHNLKLASEGNQAALETTGGMLAAIMLPGKKLPDGIGVKTESIAADIGKTGTVFDSIKGTQPVYPGSVIPKSFEMTLPNGQKVWVHGNATEHMAEYAASKAETYMPEAVRLASQTELRSFQAALDTATKNGMSYGRITVDGWQLEIKPPRAAGELPTVIHARYLGAN